MEVFNLGKGIKMKEKNISFTPNIIQQKLFAFPDEL